MSARVSNEVWQHSKAEGTALLVMLAIADQAGDDGVTYIQVESRSGKMSISSKVSTQSEFEFGVSVEANAGFLFASATVSSHVDYRTSNTYSYSAEGSSLLRTTLKPVPPPARIMPRFITVNTLVSPPQVTFSE